MDDINNSVDNELGLKVREARKKVGLTMKELAEKVGVSYLTIHRVENAKVSPSVSLLSDIAHVLKRPISRFFERGQGQYTLIRSEEQIKIASDRLDVRVVIPRGVISDSITINVGRGKTGEFVGAHKTKGFELSYIIRGRCLVEYGTKKLEMNRGDVMYFDGQILHSVTALEPLEFLLAHFGREE